jgi:rubrerythrin
MWKSQSNKRYYWAGMREEMNALLSELRDAESEEDTDIYLVMMHLDNSEELRVFDAAERKKICHLLHTLVRDSERHRRTLTRLSQVINRYTKEMSSS